jgi:hypothetical protein
MHNAPGEMYEKRSFSDPFDMEDNSGARWSLAKVKLVPAVVAPVTLRVWALMRGLARTSIKNRMNFNFIRLDTTNITQEIPDVRQNCVNNMLKTWELEEV